MLLLITILIDPFQDLSSNILVSTSTLVTHIGQLVVIQDSRQPPPRVSPAKYDCRMKTKVKDE